ASSQYASASGSTPTRLMAARAIGSCKGGFWDPLPCVGCPPAGWGRLLRGVLVCGGDVGGGEFCGGAISSGCAALGMTAGASTIGWSLTGLVSLTGCVFAICGATGGSA